MRLEFELTLIGCYLAVHLISMGFTLIVVGCITILIQVNWFRFNLLEF